MVTVSVSAGTRHSRVVPGGPSSSAPSQLSTLADSKTWVVSAIGTVCSWTTRVMLPRTRVLLMGLEW